MLPIVSAIMRLHNFCIASKESKTPASSICARSAVMVYAAWWRARNEMSRTMNHSGGRLRDLEEERMQTQLKSSLKQREIARAAQS